MKKDILDSALESLQKYLDSPEGQKYSDEYFSKLKKEEDILNGRLLLVEKYLKEHNFEKIMTRLIKEHDDTYRDKCYNKGYEPYPNNKFNLLYSYITENYAPLENGLIPQDFLSSSHFFKGYWFVLYCGQGCFTRVYNANLENILQI